MAVSVSASLQPLPVPAHYMRVTEQDQIREMTGPTGRPAGDHRSAERIIENSPVMKRFLDTADHYQIGDDLKKRVGDWTEANPDPEARADAAYDLDKVLRFIDNVDDRTLQGGDSRNGKIEGFSDHGYRILNNSEADLLEAFAHEGYLTLRHLRA